MSNTHLLFNKKRGDVKLAQLAHLLADIDLLTRKYSGESNRSVPVIMCGDFNSLPYSSLYDFVAKGSLVYHRLNRALVSGQCKDDAQCNFLPKILFPTRLGFNHQCRWIQSLDKEKEKSKTELKNEINDLFMEKSKNNDKTEKTIKSKSELNNETTKFGGDMDISLSESDELELYSLDDMDLVSTCSSSEDDQLFRPGMRKNEASSSNGPSKIKKDSKCEKNNRSPEGSIKIQKEKESNALDYWVVESDEDLGHRKEDACQQKEDACQWKEDARQRKNYVCQRKEDTRQRMEDARKRKKDTCQQKHLRQGHEKERQPKEDARQWHKDARQQKEDVKKEKESKQEGSIKRKREKSENEDQKVIIIAQKSNQLETKKLEKTNIHSISNSSKSTPIIILSSDDEVDVSINNLKTNQKAKTLDVNRNEKHQSQTQSKQYSVKGDFNQKVKTSTTLGKSKQLANTTNTDPLSMRLEGSSTDSDDSNIKKLETLHPEDGVLTHGFSFQSSYCHQNHDGTKEVSTCHDRDASSVDYIFYSSSYSPYSAQNNDWDTIGASKERLWLSGVLTLLSESMLERMGRLPNRYFSSDHLMLMASFVLR